MGGIYLCFDRELGGRLTVIKVISRIAEQLNGVDLKRELGFSRAIHHPNVLSGHEFFRDDEFVAFTMDYAEGGSLRERLDQGPISVGDSLRILSQLAAGLEAVHAHGFLHRDLKPENILISHRSVAKIADFGIAITNGEPREGSCGSRISGTMNYLSPEYLVDGRYEARSDIYSLGVLGYEMLSGRMPFVGNSLIETLRLRVRFDPTPLHHLDPSIPSYVSELILSTMSRQINRRPASAGVLRIAIENALAGLGSGEWEPERKVA